MELLLKDGINEEDCMASPQKIQEALNTMQLAAVPTSQGEKFIKVKPHTLALEIFKRMGINIPGNINTKNELIDRFKLNTEPSAIQMGIL